MRTNRSKCLQIFTHAHAKYAHAKYDEAAARRSSNSGTPLYTPLLLAAPGPPGVLIDAVGLARRFFTILPNFPKC